MEEIENVVHGYILDEFLPGRRPRRADREDPADHRRHPRLDHHAQAGRLPRGALRDHRRGPRGRASSTSTRSARSPSWSPRRSRRREPEPVRNRERTALPANMTSLRSGSWIVAGPTSATTWSASRRKPTSSRVRSPSRPSAAPCSGRRACPAIASRPRTPPGGPRPAPAGAGRRPRRGGPGSRRCGGTGRHRAARGTGPASAGRSRNSTTYW